MIVMALAVMCVVVLMVYLRYRFLSVSWTASRHHDESLELQCRAPQRARSTGAAAQTRAPREACETVGAAALSAVSVEPHP
jgi:hypothetical protein